MSPILPVAKGVLHYLPWLAAYLAAMAAVTGSLAYVRRQTVARLGTAQARADWQVWKAETEKQANSPGPVRRRKVRSDEPPALVLLRDYFGTLAAAAWTLGACCFLFLMMVVRGMRKTP